MAANTRKEAAKRFAAYWSERRGSEKGEDQTFWNSLLSEVLGVSDVKSRIHYQEPVHYKGTTKFLDAWIPETQVLIEHKSRGVDLDAPQAHHDGQTPFQQAWDYDNNRPRREKARWIVVTNFDEIRIHDMEADVPETTFETILLKDLAKEVHRLDFLVKEVESIREKEARVSIEAGRVVGKLYNAFLEQVGEGAKDPKVLRDLNILCVRLVFCVYAEDAGVFEKDAFLKFLRQFKPASFHLQLKELFKVLAQRPEERGGFLAPELKAFPYVGGGLFRDETDIPIFSDKVAHILLDEASEHFDWSEISPTIFGAVFESTLNPETRRKGGMHYTSEENIHKVIDPLFLDDFRDGFAAIKEKPAGKARDRELEAFQKKLGGLTFLDPACGSGNFLTETYISLRKLENEALALRFRGQGQFDLEDRKLVHVSINQFYGIEINDFAVTVAQTAMWIAECKMMEDTNRILSKNFTPLPLTDSAKIVEGNALRMDWEGLLSNADESECSANAPRHFDYIMGNPPFVGARMMAQGGEQKREIEELFGQIKDVQDLDYVCGWYKKAAGAIQGSKTRVGFVATNSIAQGSQVPILWSVLLNEHHVTIDYAHRTFKWDSEAIDKAAVFCVIVGFSVDNAPRKKLLFTDGVGCEVDNISPYLVAGPNNFVVAAKETLCDVPKMNFGNQPRDGGFLVLSEEERAAALVKEQELAKWIRPYVGAEEFINAKKRYCLWLKKATPLEIARSEFLSARVAAVREFRLASKAKTTNGYAKVPHLFAQLTQPDDVDYLIIPRVSSERRRYIPIGYEKGDVISSDAVQIVPHATLYNFGVLTSKVHMAWMRTVCGRLEMRYRYSKEIVYNPFPWPDVKLGQTGCDIADFKAEIERTAQAILDARQKYAGASFAELYGEKMYLFADLVAAHAANDAAVMKAYGWPTDLSESEIVSRLFAMYATLAKE